MDELTRDKAYQSGLDVPMYYVEVSTEAGLDPLTNGWNDGWDLHDSFTKDHFEDAMLEAERMAEQGYKVRLTYDRELIWESED